MLGVEGVEGLESALEPGTEDRHASGAATVATPYQRCYQKLKVTEFSCNVPLLKVTELTTDY